MLVNHYKHQDCLYRPGGEGPGKPQIASPGLEASGVRQPRPKAGGLEFSGTKSVQAELNGAKAVERKLQYCK